MPLKLRYQLPLRGRKNKKKVSWNGSCCKSLPQGNSGGLILAYLDSCPPSVFQDCGLTPRCVCHLTDPSDHQPIGAISMYHQNAFISGYNDAFLPQEPGKDQLQPIWMDFNAFGCLGKRISNASLLNVLKLQMQIYSSFSLKLQAPTRVPMKTNTKILKGFGSRGRASLAFSLIWSSQQLKKCMFFISPILQRGRKEY